MIQVQNSTIIIRMFMNLENVMCMVILVYMSVIVIEIIGMIVWVVVAVVARAVIVMLRCFKREPCARRPGSRIAAFRRDRLLPEPEA